jgi:dolichol-phosphate mannosyltransferase
MIHWIGFSTIVLPFKASARVAGTSKYSWSKMTSLALDGITSFSTVPLYISAFFGAILFAFAAIYALYVISIRLFFNMAIQGWASTLFVQLVIGGFICLFLGVIGIYLAAIYDEVKQRPNYIIKDLYED